MPGSNTPITVPLPTGLLPPNYLTEDRSHVLLAVAILFLILEIPAFGFRVVARRLKSIPCRWDDILMIPALIMNISLCVLAIIMIPLTGVGHHTLPVAISHPEKLVNLGKTSLLAMPILYLLSVAFSKFSILALYLQIFTFGPTRKITYLVGIIIILQTVAGVITTIFQCNPISLIWRSEGEGTCINSTALLRYVSIPNVGTDLVMLFLPLPTVWGMKNTTQVKVGLTITFLAASVGIVTSIIRMVGFIESDMFKDPAWFATNLIAYTIAEPGMYFLAACFPAYRPLFRYVKNCQLFRIFTSRYRLSSQRKNFLKGKEDAGAWEHLSFELTRPPKAARGFDSVVRSRIEIDELERR